jgi:hypothetical protein
MLLPPLLLLHRLGEAVGGADCRSHDEGHFEVNRGARRRGGEQRQQPWAAAAAAAAAAAVSLQQ